jgi:protein-disulfide isomerase
MILAALMTGAHAMAIAQSAASPSKPASNAAATVDGKIIAESELEDAIQTRLISLKSEEYNLKRQVLQEKIDQILLEKEAAREGLSLEQFTQKKIDGVIRPATEDQIKAVYESTKDQYKDKTEAEAFKQIQENLHRARIDLRRSELLQDLRSKAEVEVLLDPPRVSVATDNARVAGPKNAPVTIVEFADFQCPFCGRTAATLKELREKYGDQLRIVFRDFPLAFHQNAAKAAEAASCANEQGKFWDMHDKLFANQAKLAVADLRRYAGQIGLNENLFDHCLDSGEFSQKWQADRDEGQRYGITGTPTFFINGRMLVGAAQYDIFSGVIDEELKRLRPSRALAPTAATRQTAAGGQGQARY